MLGKFTSNHVQVYHQYSRTVSIKKPKKVRIFDLHFFAFFAFRLFYSLCFSLLFWYFSFACMCMGMCHYHWCNFYLCFLHLFLCNHRTIYIHIGMHGSVILNENIISLLFLNLSNER